MSPEKILLFLCIYMHFLAANHQLNAKCDWHTAAVATRAVCVVMLDVVLVLVLVPVLQFFFFIMTPSPTFHRSGLVSILAQRQVNHLTPTFLNHHVTETLHTHTQCWNITSMRNELRKALCLEKSVLHEKGHCSDDSTSVVGMMELSLIRMFHCGVNYDPPTSEELQQGPVPTCMSNVGYKCSVFNYNRNPQLCARTHWSTAVASTSLNSCSLSGIKWETENTRTPAATDAMEFLLSPQSTLHSQSPHRIPSRKPDMTVGEKGVRSNNAWAWRRYQKGL